MKKLLITINLLLVTSIISAQCLSGDCENGFGKIKYQDGSSYEGTFKNNFPSGLGIVFYPNGNYYFGQMLIGKLDGFGTLYSPDKQNHFGKWQNSKQQGIGIYKDANGNPTAGNWEIGTFMTAKNTEVQTLNPKNCIGNCINGYGRITNADGSQIQAIFENGIPTFGQVKNTYFTYEGEIKNNVPNGYGQISYSNGDHYFGFFKEGKKHGKGILSPKGKEKIYGEWMNDAIIELNETEFCKEITKLTDLSKSEVLALPLEKKPSLLDSRAILKNRFLTFFQLSAKVAPFSNDYELTISFPKTDLKTSVKELNEILSKCVNFVKNQDSYFSYKNNSISISEDKLGEIYTIIIRYPDKI